MTVLSEIQGLFTPASVAASMEALPELKSTMLDLLFPKTVNHPSPVIGLHELETVVGTQPVVRRDGMPIPYQGRPESAALYVARPLKPSVDVTASELNDLKVYWGSKVSRQAFVSRKIDQLRQLVRNSTEGMASVVATTGQLSWPSRVEGGGFEDYVLDFGTIPQLDPPTGWDETDYPSLQEIYNHLSALDQAVAESGGGGGVKFLAGKKAFGALLDLVEHWRSTAPGGVINAKLESGAVNIAGYEIRRVADRYQSPLDGSWVEKAPEDFLLGYSNIPGTVYYLAADSISANNEPRPFHVVVEPVPGDAALRIIAQAKPAPARNPRTLILSQVTGL